MTDTFPEAAYDPSAQLGCAARYSAAIHWLGGARVYVPTNLLDEALSEVTWERRLTETSPARIVISKASMADECCGLLGEIHPWLHELTVYRDADLVWQGPITTVTEDQAAVTIDALDITAWLSRVVNTQPVRYKSATDPVLIAQAVITSNLMDTDLASPSVDWPGLLPYLYTRGSDAGIKLVRKSVWTDTVLNIVNNLSAKGFEWTTVGRRMVIRPPATSSTRARARLTPDDLPGGIQVSRDGMDAATRIFATSQSDTEDGITVSTEIRQAGQFLAPRLDQMVRDNPRVDVETDAEHDARIEALRKARQKRDNDADDKYDADTKARRTQANAALKAIAALSDATCNRKCKDDRSDDERDDRDNDILAYRRTRDDTKKASRIKYENDLAASNAAVEAEEREAVAAVLLTEAKQALKGRWPTPVGVTVQDGAQLARTAPLTVAELVPGERVDVATIGYCQAVTQAMRLARVTGAWGDNGEAIGISLVPLSELAEVG